MPHTRKGTVKFLPSIADQIDDEEEIVGETAYNIDAVRSSN